MLLVIWKKKQIKVNCCFKANQNMNKCYTSRISVWPLTQDAMQMYKDSGRQACCCSSDGKKKNKNNSSPFFILSVWRSKRPRVVSRKFPKVLAPAFGWGTTETSWKDGIFISPVERMNQLFFIFLFIFYRNWREWTGPTPKLTTHNASQCYIQSKLLLAINCILWERAKGLD